MENAKSKVIVIYGPTASGKSDAAIRLAKAIHPVKSDGVGAEQFNGVNGEIISADSRQIYKGLNIGSGKVNGAWSMEHGAFESEGVAHHLIDVAQPLEDYNISHFKKDAEKIIQDIIERGKIPIICGGTNFWIDSIVHDSQIPEVAPNKELRKELQQKSAEELFFELQKLDSERATNIDSKNKVRLIRAIEICKTLGKVPTQSSVISHQSSKKYDFLQLGILTEKEKLNEKIKLRLDERFEEGMIEEVENLNKNGVSFEWMEKIGLEYRWISRYLQNKASIEEMKEKLYFDIIHYAKRQMTWLKRNKEIIWTKEYKEIETEAKKFI